MEDLITQERLKLHMASDNIRQMLQVIEDRDEENFFWAWHQIESNLLAIQNCFIGIAKEHCDMLDEFFKHHEHILKKRLKLDKKLTSMPKITDLPKEELEEFIQNMKKMISDLRDKFGLSEFEEQS